MQTILKPAMEAAAITTINAQREVMAKLFPNRNVNREFDIFLDPASVSRIEKDRSLYGQAKGLNPAYEDFISKNPKGVEAAFHAQYESMMGAIGAPLMQAAMPVMRSITDMFNKIGEFANAHPVAIQYIGEGFAALGIALTVAGGVAILAALGPAGWIALGLTALGTAIMMVPWKDVFDSITGAITDFAHWAKSFVPSYGGGKGVGDAPIDPLTGMPMPDAPTLPQKQSWNAIPPSGGGQLKVTVASVNLDGRKVGEATLRYIVDEGRGASQGSAYFDGTFGSTPTDLAVA